MGYLSVQALASTVVSRKGESLGEIPKVKSSLRVRQNCLLPTCNWSKIIKPHSTTPEASQGAKCQERHPALGRYPEDLWPNSLEVSTSPFSREQADEKTKPDIAL